MLLRIGRVKEDKYFLIAFFQEKKLIRNYFIRIWNLTGALGLLPQNQKRKDDISSDWNVKDDILLRIDRAKTTIAGTLD